MNGIGKLLLVGSLVLGLSTLAYAGGGGSISATQSETITNIKGFHLLLVNDGVDEVFIETRQEPEGVQTATISSFELKNGESLVIDSNRGFTAVNVICNTGETATVRFKTWF